MPAIYVFRRKTLLGGDDLQVPCVIAACLRLFQSTCLILPLCFYLVNQAQQETIDNPNAVFLRKLLKYLWDDHDNDDYYCSQVHLYPMLSALFLFTSTLFCLVSFILEYRLWYWSCQGTPTIREPRTSKVESLLEWKIILTAIMLLFTSLTFLTACAFAKTYHTCFRQEQEQLEQQHATWVSSHSWYILGAVLFLTQTAELVVTVLFALRLTSCFGLYRQPDPNNDGILTTPSNSSARQHELIEEMWADRCNMLCHCLSISTCFLFGGRDLVTQSRTRQVADATDSRTASAAASGGQFGIYQHVAQALADYLETRGTLDVVPTDLVTGLLVLQRLQRQRILQARRHVMEVQRQQQSSSSLLQHDGNNSSDVLFASHVSADTKTGLRSRVSSSNDLLRHRSLSPTSHHSGHSQQQDAPSSPSKEHPQKSAVDAFIAPLKSVAGKSTPTKRLFKPPASSSVLPETTRLVSSMGAMPTPPSSFPNPSTLLQPSPSPLPPSHTAPISIHMSLNQPAEAAADQYDQYQLQRAIYRRCHSQNRTHGYYRATSRQVLSPYNPVDIQRLEEGARMAKYALAIYTWMLYVFVHPISGMPRLCCRSCKVCCLHRTMLLCGRGNSSNGNDRQRVPPYSDTTTQRRRRQRRHSTRNEDLLNDNERVASPSSNGSASTGASDYFDDGNMHTGGDTLCEWHKHALLLVAGLSESDLVYAQFENRFSLVPYCILLDHDHTLVILSIRGSLSLEDCVTDTLVQPQPLDDVGVQFGFDAKGEFCHAGVLACFENIVEDLRRHGLLEQLLLDEYPNYELRIVGHSLGAGVATLLSYILKSKFPTLKVYGFAPPGCTMTWKLASECTPWTTSFVLDNDIVPRLSVLALEDLRDEVLELIGRIRVPKYKVFETFFRGRDGRRGCLCGSDGDSSGLYFDDLDDLTQVIQGILDETPRDTLYYRQVQEFLHVQHSRKESRGETNSRRIKFYPPGRMIHLLKTGEEGGCTHLLTKVVSCCTSNSGFRYTPVYISNDDLDEVVVNGTMGTDHFIDRISDELQKVAMEYRSQGGGSTDLSNGHEIV